MKTIATNFGAIRVLGNGRYRFDFVGAMAVLSGEEICRSETEAIGRFYAAVENYGRGAPAPSPASFGEMSAVQLREYLDGCHARHRAGDRCAYDEQFRAAAGEWNRREDERVRVMRRAARKGGAK